MNRLSTALEHRVKVDKLCLGSETGSDNILCTTFVSSQMLFSLTPQCYFADVQTRKGVKWFSSRSFLLLYLFRLSFFDQSE